MVPGSALDVGCGSGGLVGFLARQEREVLGIDVSQPIVDAARAFLRREGLSEGLICKNSTSELRQAGARYDNVISMDCLEHVPDDQALFDDLVALVRPGKNLIITVPAMPIVFGPRDLALGHFRRYTKESLLKLVNPDQLELKELRYWNGLGVLPTLLSSKVLKRSIDESFRFGEQTLSRRALNRGLNVWFRHVENRVRLPAGLTLVMSATRRAS
ncbi:methyltransferase domain-containing protein [Myxococcota bacterium]|nr:methyltransferase domain-containing protein [Myxococcota bacterium]MBU1431247.1 methyltransferase domain-containing protein [Myxococcota bacterium]MBU1898064.1 methyltransferase domain-containing protein [Myxococcota bacterium]